MNLFSLHIMKWWLICSNEKADFRLISLMWIIIWKDNTLSVITFYL